MQFSEDYAKISSGTFEAFNKDGKQTFTDNYGPDGMDYNLYNPPPQDPQAYKRGLHSHQRMVQEQVKNAINQNSYEMTRANKGIKNTMNAF